MPFPSDYIRADTAKSESFFCHSPDVAVTADDIERLAAHSRAIGRQNVRLCLHASPQALFHEMVILEYAGHYCRPHRHPDKPESCHILSGRLAVIVLDDGGAVLGRHIVCAATAPLFRIGANRWHTVVPLTDYVVYHEAKPGPFDRDNDNRFAAFAPDGGDPAASRHYLDSLLGPQGGRP